MVKLCDSDASVMVARRHDGRRALVRSDHADGAAVGCSKILIAAAVELEKPATAVVGYSLPVVHTEQAAAGDDVVAAAC